MLKRGTKIPLIDFIVDLQSKTNRDNVVTRAAMYQSMYVVTAEEVCYHDQVLYQEHDMLDRHSNILQFYGKKEFQQRSYFVFGWYESNLLDFMLSGNLAEHSKLHAWIGDIVKGLSWLHEKGSHHGCIRPHNIVIRDNKAMLHGLTKNGNKKDDLEGLAALLFYFFSGVTCEFPYSRDYIPSVKVCYDQLHDRDPEAYDLVEGLLTSRLQLCDVLMHPKFWTTPKRLDFIRVTSNYLLTSWDDVNLEIEEMADDIYLRFKADPSLEGLFVGFITHSQYYGNLNKYGVGTLINWIVASVRYTLAWSQRCSRHC
ncbi:serine/threonine-protein kinase/endoribonuclease IRE1a, partial [Tanacetum coccineum]